MWLCPACFRAPTFIIVFHVFFNVCHTATIKDILNLDTNKLVRVPRDEKLYLDRYGGNTASETVLNNRVVKPEDASDARDPSGINLGKRCIRCESGRYPGNYDPYDRRGYEDRGYRDRYNDRYDDRDRYYDRRYDEPYDRYNYDRYDRYDRYDQRRDYYDRDRHYGDRDRDRIYDRGIGYDNRGYDYRDYRDRDGYRDRDYNRPNYYDDRDDLSGRGYGGRPSYYGGGYASSWNYGGGRDDSRDRYGDDRYRYRDPYDGYRATSYLYGRPSTSPISNTTTNPTNSGVTEPPGSSG